MATSGSFSTSSYNSYPYPNKYTLTWSRTSTGSNSSNISWQIYGDGGAGGGYYQVNHGTRVYLNGGLIKDREDDINLTQGYVLFTGSFTINHDTNGNASFSMSANGDLNTYAQSVSGSGSWSLNRIALAPTIGSVSASSVKQTKATLTTSISSNGHGTSTTVTMYYKLSTAGSYTSLGSGTSKNLTGLKPGKTYDFYATAVNNNGDSTTSSVHTFTTLPASGMISVIKAMI